MTAHLLRDDDVDTEQQLQILDLASQMKRDRYAFKPLAGPKTVALLFDKPSTRTRVSFSVGVTELGGSPLVLDSGTTQLGRGEPVEDTARVLERQVAAIAWRTFEQANLERMAAVSRVPVINTLSDWFHPCQIFADLLTIQEWHDGALAGLTLTYLGDGSNNMAHSYLLGCAIAGMHVRIAAPHEFAPNNDIVNRASAIAAQTGGSVEIFDEAKRAAYGADVLATDTWSSMGSGPLGQHDQRLLRPFGITQDLVDLAGTEPTVLHCLPAYRGKEITAEVLEGPRSAAWDQAENRLHVQKAILTHLLERS